MAKWGALRSWWIRDEEGQGLRSFTGSKAGTSIAALKVLAAVSILADFHTRKVRISQSDLEVVTGLSHPMIIAGVRDLEDKGVLRVDRGGHINEYEIVVEGGDENFGKLPEGLLRKRLPEMANRGAIPLAALKVYFLLATERPNESPSLAMGHDRIRAKTGIQAKHVRPALDILINHGLVRVDLHEGTTGFKGRHNTYTLLGIRLKSQEY